jgi:hypothetical protein
MSPSVRVRLGLQGSLEEQEFIAMPSNFMQQDILICHSQTIILPGPSELIHSKKDQQDLGLISVTL